MKTLLAMAVVASASAASASDVSMSTWAKCMASYAQPRLKSEQTVKIVDDGMRACAREENAERVALVRENGPVGEEMFRGIRAQVRQHMIGFVQLAKAQRGYR
jgi:hypothetical protein